MATSPLLGIDTPDDADTVDVPGDMADMVADLESHPGITALSSSAITALTSEQKPAGRVVYNTTSGRLQRSNGSTFVDIAEDASVVLKGLFDAYTIIYADTDNTPTALTVGSSTIVGRKASGGISAMSASEAKTILGLSTAVLSSSITAIEVLTQSAYDAIDPKVETTLYVVTD